MHNTQKDSIIKGYLNPAGGHIEENETVLEAAKREVLEEMGITNLSNLKLRGTVNVKGFKEHPVFMFIVTALVPSDQKPTANDEGEPIWVDLKVLHNYKVLEDVEMLIKTIKGTSYNEMFYAKSVFEDKKLISFEVV